MSMFLCNKLAMVLAAVLAFGATGGEVTASSSRMRLRLGRSCGRPGRTAPMRSPMSFRPGGAPFARPGNVVSIVWTCADGVVRYTTDGSDVTVESPVYEAPFTIDVTTMVKAKAFGVEYFDSAQVAVELVRKMEKVATPVITAAAHLSARRPDRSQTGRLGNAGATGTSVLQGGGVDANGGGRRGIGGCG